MISSAPLVLYGKSKMQVHQPGHHLAFALAHARHIDPRIVLSDAKFGASEKILRL